jgi:nucleoside-diphosphate-sugar epimerase
MSLLVTGGQGFVMSHVVKAWALRHTTERIVLLDQQAPDAMAARFFAPIADRLTFVQADIRDHAAWHPLVRAEAIDRIVHGAALTPHAFTDQDGRKRDPEFETPESVIEVNLNGTLAVLALARVQPPRRLIVVSTGSVYGDEGPTDRGLPEDGFVSPQTLYGISKYAAELIARRYDELYGLPIVTARLASVFGPMDRLLPSRHVIHAPNRMTALALSGEPIRLNSGEAVGDFISASDVATGLIRLLEADRPRQKVYNLGSGKTVSYQKLAELTTRLIPGSTWSIDPHSPNVVADPKRRYGQWGAYDTSRLASEFGWAPLALEERLAEYIAWRRKEELAFDL